MSKIYPLSAKAVCFQSLEDNVLCFSSIRFFFGNGAGIFEIPGKLFAEFLYGFGCFVCIWILVFAGLAVDHFVNNNQILSTNFTKIY